MSFNTALSGGQLTQLRQDRWQGDQLVSLWDNVIAFHSTVTADINNGAGLTTNKIPYGATISGSTSNILQTAVVIISPNSDIRNSAAVRLHVTYHVVDGTYIYVSEFSDPISSGSHVWVLYAFDLIDNLSRPVNTGGIIIQYEQYDQNFERMAPVINGAQTAYANWVDSGGHLTIAFDLSTSFAPEYGRSISSYLATVIPTGAGTYSVTSGALNTSAFTLQLTYGEFILKLTATDSGGVAYFRYVLIKAHDRTNYPPSYGFEGIEITRDVAGGPSARIKAFTGVSSLINGTTVIIWVGDEQYSDWNPTSNVSGSLQGATENIDLVGWIEAEENMFVTDPQYSAYAECEFEVQGVGARLMRLEGQLLAITNNASPSKWDQINKLTPWRAIVHFLQRHTTALQLCSFTLQNMATDETFLFPTLSTIAGRALDNVTGSQGLAEMINAQLEFAPDGRMQLTRREQFVATDLSHTAVVVATLNGQDFGGSDALRWKFNHYLQYGYLSADGAYWDGTSPLVVPKLARAPGLAQGSGPDQGRLNNQVLASTTNPVVAQAELSQRAGTQWRIDNETGELTIAHRSQCHWLIPSYGQVYVWDLDTTFNIRGWTLDSSTHWMLKQLTIRHDNKSGSREVKGVYIPVVTGTPAAPVPVVNQNSITPAVPILPPMPATPIEYPETTIPDTGTTPTGPVDQKVNYNGNTVLEVHNSGANLSITRTYIDLTSPLWADVTPTLPAGYFQDDACFDPFVTGGKAAIYDLATDGTDSTVLYTADALSQPWSQGATLAKVFTLIRTSKDANKVLIYTPDGSSSIYNDDLQTGLGSKTFLISASYPFGVYANANAGVYSSSGGRTGGGCILGQDTGVIDGGFSKAEADAAIDLGSAQTVTAISFWYKASASGQPFGVDIQLWDASKAHIATVYTANPSSSTTWAQASWSGSQSGVRYISFNTNSNYTQCVPSIDDLSVSYSGGGGNSAVRVSSDNGATFAAEVAVGTSPGSIGGFDVQSAGSVSVAAADHAINQATTLGGAYSNLAVFASDQVPCLVIPWYRMTSDTVSQTTASDPDVLFGLNGSATGGSCVGWIDGALTTIVYKTQPAVGAFVPGPDCLTVLRGTKVAGIFDVSGQRKLYVSEDSMTTWTFVENVGPTATLRDRRHDPRTGSHKGQLFVFDTTPSGYSSQWANNGEKDRTSPFGTVLAGDVLG